MMMMSETEIYKRHLESHFLRIRRLSATAGGI